MRLDRMRNFAPKERLSRQQGNVCENDTPPVWKTNPGLALAAACYLPRDFTFKGYGDAGEVFAERNNLKPGDGSGQVSRRAPFAKGFNLADPVKTLTGAKTRDIGRGPEHIHQSIYVVCD